jgi:hypothetical protein
MKALPPALLSVGIKRGKRIMRSRKQNEREKQKFMKKRLQRLPSMIKTL